MTVGSLADAPKDLLNEIEHLEKLFTIDTAKLKEITQHFVNELTKGECALGGDTRHTTHDTPAQRANKSQV